MTINRWDDPRYRRIIGVERQNDNLSISFADNSVVSLNVDQLMPPDMTASAWDSISVDSHEIVIPTSSGEIEIPWSTIRLLTDKEFAAFWSGAAEEEAKQIGARLRALRLKRNLSGKEVAKRAGIAPQSLSRIERGHHDVVFTTLSRILAGMGYSLQDLAEVQTTPASLAELTKHLEKAGIKKEWFLRRMLPPRLIAAFESGQTDASLMNQAAGYVSRVFGWPTESILTGFQLNVDDSAVQAAMFKTQGRMKIIEATAYAAYAHYLALVVLEATDHLPVLPLPRTAEEVRTAVIDKYGAIDFENMVQYVWSLGIPVIPLHDSGAFHGACWRISNRNVIVLKQVTPYQSRWLYDLTHEFGHVIKHLSEDRQTIIETEEINPFQDSDEEWEANTFADEILLFGRAEELAQISAEKARGNAKFLKSAVIQVAAAEHISVDVLANYIAYRVSKTDNVNWWGAANNLQVTEPPPLELAQGVFLEKAMLDRLNPMDEELVIQAMS